MWIATRSRGLYEFRDRRLAENPGPPGNERITGVLSVAGQGGRSLGERGEWDRVVPPGRGVGSGTPRPMGCRLPIVTCLAQEADGTLWAGSLDDGLYGFQAGRFVALRKEQGLSANDIRSLCPDREGNLWVGTRTGGLNRLSRRKLLSYGAAQGLTNDYTRSVAETADGTLWVATTGGGLYRGGPEGFEPIAPVLFLSPESVLAARDGSLWWGGARGLLCWRDGELSASYTNETWVRSATVTALCEDRQGGLWVGTSEGRLVHFENGKFVELPHRAAARAHHRPGAGSQWQLVGGFHGRRPETLAIGERFHSVGYEPAQPSRSHALFGWRGLGLDWHRRSRAMPLAERARNHLYRPGKASGPTRSSKSSRMMMAISG